jgi:hypothetical protein
MKRLALGILVVVGLVITAVAVAQQRGEPFNNQQRLMGSASLSAATAPAAVASDLIVMPTGEKGMLTVVDPRMRAIAVYHIDPANGKIALRSVRNIQWDLQIMDLNNENPVPQQIHSLLEQR